MRVYVLIEYRWDNATICGVFETATCAVRLWPVQPPLRWVNNTYVEGLGAGHAIEIEEHELRGSFGTAALMANVINGLIQNARDGSDDALLEAARRAEAVLVDLGFDPKRELEPF